MNAPRILSSIAALLLLTSVAMPQEAKDKPADLIRSAKSGVWSAPATWEGGKIPAAGARV